MKKQMRVVNTSDVGDYIYKLIEQCSFYLPRDILSRLENYSVSQMKGSNLATLLVKNAKIASEKRIPLCQDTGMVVVFLEVGDLVYLQGDFIEDVINLNVAKAYTDFYLRKSIVDPLTRKNSGDNTPAIIHTKYIKGEKIKLKVLLKGFGSENMSKIYMLRPTDGIEKIEEIVLKTVKEAGPNPCPPIVVGIGIGGTFEKAAILSKEALVRDLDEPNEDIELNNLEQSLLKKINELGIGVSGLGGQLTALGVSIKKIETHIAGMPIAINISCHSSRHMEVEL
jgi:fumarate hydratase subunit alpha